MISNNFLVTQTVLPARLTRWRCASLPSLRPLRFSNGCVTNAESLDFSLYKNRDENNPRKKSRRILVAESNRLSYVGQNFGAGSLKCNSLCKYYVGVLNKQTMQMEVHNAVLFNMQPVIPGKNRGNYFLTKGKFIFDSFSLNKQSALSVYSGCLSLTA
uniref:Uncharacterized protein n=1 Tax=Xiphophorus couchianus TaxID=32473 RepID=A0A3B5MEZ7_9TELE